jgi:hypothetical protein
MASPHVYDELKAYLQGVVAPVPVLDWDQIEMTLEQQQDPFLALEEVFGENEMISFGDPSALCFREDATILIHCFVPAPESSNAGRVLAEQVQRALHLRQVNGVRVLNVQPPEPGELNDGLWSLVSVTTDLTMDRFEPRP